MYEGRVGLGLESQDSSREGRRVETVTETTKHKCRTFENNRAVAELMDVCPSALGVSVLFVCATLEVEMKRL